jgi:hypothetical protein
VLEAIITEHEQTTSTNKTHHGDFVDILLSIMNQTIDSETDPLLKNCNLGREFREGLIPLTVCDGFGEGFFKLK